MLNNTHDFKYFNFDYYYMYNPLYIIIYTFIKVICMN
jgi:hypothetical protein